MLRHFSVLNKCIIANSRFQPLSVWKCAKPVLVLYGRQDPMDPWMAYQTSAAFSQSTLRFIDRAGHFPRFDQPAEFSKVLDDFVESR